MTNLFSRTISAATLVGALVAGMIALPSAASANDWQQGHPARHEINQRIARQNHRITMERRQGEISPRQAHMLRHRDHMVRMEERRDARFDHNRGHLNRDQVRHLNHELNNNSRSIGH